MLNNRDQSGGTAPGGSAGFWLLWICGVIMLAALVFYGARLGMGYSRCKGKPQCARQAAREAVYRKGREPSFEELLLAFLPEDTGPAEGEDSEGNTNADDKLAKFLIKPPAEPAEEVPDWLKDKGDASGKKQRGDEGKMGAPDSRKKSGLYGLKGPKAGMDPHLAKRLAGDAAKNAGVLGLLRQQDGQQIAAIFGRDTALGSARPAPLRVRPTVSVGQPKVDGALKASVVKGVLKRRVGDVEKCYRRNFTNRAVQQARKESAGEIPKEVARVTVQLIIKSSGWVTAAAVRRSSSYHHQAETCLNEKMRGWRFHHSRQGRPVVADVPLVLTWKLQPKKDQGRR